MTSKVVKHSARYGGAVRAFDANSLKLNDAMIDGRSV